jgi:hypothetical protein
MALTPARLRKVRTLDDMLGLLADDLDWPIGTDDLEEATFDYSPGELGIPAEQVPQLRSLRQLRPLTTHQPWGIFFLDFSGPRLPLTPLRRLLQRLVATKRTTIKQHPTWALADLLFVITTDTADSVELHFVCFSEHPGHAPEIRSLPWRPEHSPQQHLARLATELLPHLEWPADPNDSTAWSDEWRSAFKLRHGEAIHSAEHLAERMAAVATALRTGIEDAIRRERGNGPFHNLLDEVRFQLVADVDDARFADMCAQTLTYGTLSARVTDPIGFGASPTLAVVPLSNPFLAAFFEQVHDQVAVLDLEHTDLEQLVADLRATNVEAVLDQFGATIKGGDPVVHFYEEFLKRYDTKMRADAGAFYTPQPVVYFMVRAVDEVLRSLFGLSDGLADPTPWSNVAALVGFEVPPGINPDQPFLSMIDPATGTGTFLVEWIRRARASYLKDHTESEWLARLNDFVLPSLHAFELMLGPYAIAHLKVALETHNQGSDDQAVAIYLTDTLEHPAPQTKLPTMTDAVAAEGERAADLKQHERFTVCIGNPPYDREQRTADAGAVKRKGGVVRYGVPGIAPLLGAVIEPMRAAGLGKHVKNLYNDYVYFWRWGTWQTTERVPGPGITAFISASSYLDGVSMGGLRAHLRTTFDELWIVDLGGDSRGARPEENVFDIRTPVAIGIGIRTRGGSNCAVRYARVRGVRGEKLGWLSEARLDTITWTDVPGSSLDPLVPRTTGDYRSWLEVTDLFPWIHSGCQFKRTWPIAPSRSVLERRWEAITEASHRERGEALRETGFRSLDAKVDPLVGGGQQLKSIGRLKAGDRPETVAHYGYRSFDRQWALADNRLADRPRPALWASEGPRQLFLTTLTSTKLGRGPAVTATPYVPDLDHFRGSYGAKNVMPLYRDPAGRAPNVTGGLLEALKSKLGTAVTVEDLAAYVYGLTGTAAFGERFADELGEAAGPVRLPITSDRTLFERVARLGRDLLWWHTWGERFAPDHYSDLPPSKAKELEPVRGNPDSFSYGAAARVLDVGTGRFGPVSDDVWSFEVSGLKVLQSWLGYRMVNRKGRKSSPLDDIRPERWTFTDELLRVTAILQHTVDVTPRAAELLAAVVAGPLIDPATLPTPTDAERTAPKE